MQCLLKKPNELTKKFPTCTHFEHLNQFLNLFLPKSIFIQQTIIYIVLKILFKEANELHKDIFIVTNVVKTFLLISPVKQKLVRGKQLSMNK